MSKELEEMHDKAYLENSSRQLELEKENQRLAKKVILNYWRLLVDRSETNLKTA